MIKYLLIVSFLLVVTNVLLAQHYPLIEQLNDNDINYKQLINEIKENNKRLASQKLLLPLMFYGYYTQQDDTLYKVAARFNISYDSIATLNGMASPLMFEEKQLIFIPNINGLALREGENDGFFKEIGSRLILRQPLEAQLYSSSGIVTIHFIAGERFTAAERLLFLQGFFRSPLDGQLMVTSGYGNRSNPFNLDGSHHHNGIDYRAAIGTKILASRGGTVETIARNDVLGLYLVIKHENGYQTVYGHLSEVLVTKGQRLAMGMVVAKSGNSGQSTGPHLHFEVRKNGTAVNPSNLLSRAM